MTIINLDRVVGEPTITPPHKMTAVERKAYWDACLKERIPVKREEGMSIYFFFGFQILWLIGLAIVMKY